MERRRNPQRLAAAAAFGLCGTFLLYGANESLTRDYARGLKRGDGAEHAQGRRRADTGSQRQPNILFLLLDQWRYDWDGRSDHVAPNGQVPLKLPFLSSAAANGTRFTKAFVPSPLCAPSRACLASGKEYDHAGMPQNHADQYPTNQTTFYKLLRDVGDYHVMSCGKDDLFKNDVNFPYYPDPEDPNDRRLAQPFEERYPADWGHGDDDEWQWEPPEPQDDGGGGKQRELNPLNPRWGTMDIGFSDAIRSAGKTKAIRQIKPYEPYRTYLEETRVSLDNGTEIKAYDAYEACWNGTRTGKVGPMCDASSFTSEIYPDDFVGESAKALLDRKPADKPWFLQVNFPGPHPPILATADMADSVKGRTWPQPVDTATEDVCPQDTDGKPGPRNGGRCNYGAQIESLDEIMRTIVERIPTEEKDDTLICISGDHGEMLGDHGQHGKMQPWSASVGVPLVCFGAGVTVGGEHDLPVATLDLPGTFLDYAGVDDRAEGMTTRSLRSLLEATIDTSPQATKRFRLSADGEPPREYVSSGLADWRMVVKSYAHHGTSYKLVCCKGDCDGRSAAAVPTIEGDFHLLLFDTVADPFDLVNKAAETPGVLNEMRGMLPDGWCPGL